MGMTEWLVILAALGLCAINFYLFIREQEKLDRKGMIYYAVMTVLVLGITVALQTIYAENPVIFDLKRIGLLAVLVPVAYIDFREMRIPNSFILFGLLFRAVLIPFEWFTIGAQLKYTLLSEVIAAAGLFLAAALCRVMIRNSVGMGDMKLFLVVGVLLGTQGIWGAVFLSLAVSFVVAVILLARRKKSRKDSIPFGPAITCGTFLSIFLTGM